MEEEENVREPTKKRTQWVDDRTVGRVGTALEGQHRKLLSTATPVRAAQQLTTLSRAPHIHFTAPSSRIYLYVDLHFKPFLK